MNTKKTKNKNKPKSQKLSPKVEKVETFETEQPLDSIANLIVESEKKDATVLVSECVTNPLPVVEEKQDVVETPKPPKRIKGKKKQDISKDEQKSTEENVNPVASVIKSDLIEQDVTEFTQVVPNTRKKKNKDKKSSVEPKTKIDESETKSIVEEVTEEVSTIEYNTNATLSPDAAKLTDQDTKVSKKKKKKKHRHDSEKSDKNDDIQCTLAFKQLLEAKADDKEADNPKLETTSEKLEEDKKVKEIISDTATGTIHDSVHESIALQSAENASEGESSKNKNKKKNKKGKQNLNKTEDVDSEKVSENLKDEKEKVVDEIVVQPEKSLDSENSAEVVKAKIIKPVDKRRKNKSDIQSISSETTDILEDKTKHVAETIHDIKEEQTSSNKNISVPETTSKSIGLDLKSEIDPKKEDTKEKAELTQTIQSSETFSIDIKQKIEILPEITLTKENIVDGEQKVEDEFMEVKTAKKKRKQLDKKDASNLSQCGENKTEPTTSQTEQADTDLDKQSKGNDDKISHPTQLDNTADTTIKLEDIDEASIIIPDLIQYPRSTSQQLFDNNNNTVIQEISYPDEIKLGIPVYTAPPIIEGSGESPEVKSQQDQLCNVQVSEVDNKLNTNNEGKTDIKSKMMEVSQDMEELRLSIERSLAELTAIEKDDDKFERKLENKESNVTKDYTVDTPKLHDQQIKPSTSTDEQVKFAKVQDNILEKVIKTDVVMSVVEKQDIFDTPLIDKEKPAETQPTQSEQPKCPPRKDNKGKSKSRKRGKYDVATSASCDTTQSKPSDTQESTTSSASNTTQESNKTEKTEQDKTKSQEKGKQQSLGSSNDNIDSKQDDTSPTSAESCFDPIENFEDALTSSVDDVNKTFELIVNDITTDQRQYHNNPQINIIAPAEDGNKEKKEKQNPVSKPKNLLGHPDIPVPSNKTDYKKEKNKTPNCRQATVQIKDSVDIDKTPHKESKESQTNNHKEIIKSMNSESFSYMTNENEDFIYKYSFRKVFLQSSCHVCKKELVTRIPCKFCSLIFYCSQKHMSEDWPRHQSLCFAVSTIAHLKDQKHIYADAKNVKGQDYRLLRMQMIVSCEKILKRNLEPWEQEVLLYPRMCADPGCREWKQTLLKDCEGCGQISFCIEHPEHLPSSHHRWCKSYALYKKMVNYQQTKGRLEPQLPSKVLEDNHTLETLNDVLASLFESKINMTDVEYAALTQLATAPLTAAYCHQLYSSKVNLARSNGATKKSEFVLHSVGAEMQFEADALHKWEVFFLHLRPDIQNLRIALIALDLNPSNLPLELLGKLKLCENCRNKNRRIIFSFQDKMSYHDYYMSEDFMAPDIVCAFNPSIQRSSVYNGNDKWPSSINCILKQEVPFVITSYTLEELQRDLARIKECSAEFSVVSEPKRNQFASVRPDRNFITDHEMPLQFKNYCFSVVCV